MVTENQGNWSNEQIDRLAERIEVAEERLAQLTSDAHARLEELVLSIGDLRGRVQQNTTMVNDAARRAALRSLTTTLSARVDDVERVLAANHLDYLEAAAVVGDRISALQSRMVELAELVDTLEERLENLIEELAVRVFQGMEKLERDGARG